MKCALGSRHDAISMGVDVELRRTANCKAILSCAAAVLFVLVTQPAGAEKRGDQTLGFSIKFDAASVANPLKQDEHGVACTEFIATGRGFKEVLLVCTYPSRDGLSEQGFIDKLLRSTKEQCVLKDSVRTNNGYQARTWYGSGNGEDGPGTGGTLAGQIVVVPDGEGYRVYDAVFVQTAPADTLKKGDKQIDRSFAFAWSLEVTWKSTAAASLSAAETGPPDPISSLDPPATADEMAYYKKLKAGSSNEVPAFIATRKWLRAVKAMYPDKNAAIDWSKVPKAPDGLKLDYALTWDETSLFARMPVAKGAK